MTCRPPLRVPFTQIPRRMEREADSREFFLLAGLWRRQGSQPPELLEGKIGQHEDQILGQRGTDQLRRRGGRERQAVLEAKRSLGQYK